MTISFVVPGKAVGVNATYRRGKGQGLYKSAEAVDFRRRVVSAAVLARVAAGGPGAMTGPVSVRLRFFYDSRRPDVDGGIKPVLDALQVARERRDGAGIYRNDSQVQVLDVSKQLDADNPRVEVTVTELVPLTVTVDAEAVTRERKAMLAIVSPKRRAGVLAKRLVSSVRRNP